MTVLRKASAVILSTILALSLAPAVSLALPATDEDENTGSAPIALESSAEESIDQDAVVRTPVAESDDPVDSADEGSGFNADQTPTPQEKTVSQGEKALANVSVSTFADLKTALEDVNNASASEDAPVIIEVTAPIAMTEEIRAVGHVVLKSSDDAVQELLRDASYAGYLIVVDAGSTLVLEDIVVDGNKAAVTAEHALLKVMWNGAKLTLDNGAIVRNNDVTGRSESIIEESIQKGSGIFVQGGHTSYNDGSLVMNEGAVVSGMAGDATYNSYAPYNAANAAIVTEGPFVMNGGEVKDNAVQGVMVNGFAVLKRSASNILFNQATYPNGTFQMEGGSISGNTVDGDGAGVHVNAATATINSGTITGNAATGRGGGISVSTRVNTGIYSTSAFLGRLYLNGGTVSSNSAKYGGGISTLTTMGSGFDESVQPTKNSGYNYVYVSGGEITDNSADHGGGIFNEITYLEVKNATISGNIAHGYGGGILNQDSVIISGSLYNRFILENVTIKGNVAEGKLASPHTDLGITLGFTDQAYGNEIFRYAGYFWLSGHNEIGDPDANTGIAVDYGDMMTNINSLGEPLSGDVYFEYIKSTSSILGGGLHGKIFVLKNSLDVWETADVTEDELSCFHMLPNSTYPQGLYAYGEDYNAAGSNPPAYVNVGVWAYEKPEVEHDHVIVTTEEAEGYDAQNNAGDYSGYAGAVGASNWQYGYHKKSEIEEPVEIDFASLALSVPYVGTGTYELTFTTPHQGLEQKAKITANDRDALQVDLSAGEAVGANNITISAADVTSLTAEDYVRLAQAIAWSTDGLNTRLAAQPNASDIAAIPAQEGTYPLRFTAPGGTETSITVTVEAKQPTPPQPTSLTVARLFGEDRFGTSSAVALYGGSGTGGTVILASGDDRNFPDALAASSLSGAEGNAPIVLTSPGSLSADAKAAIGGLAPSRIIVVGSEDAVSAKTASQARAAAPQAAFERIGGDDRQQTADMIYERNRGSLSKTAIIALSTNFPDSLAISPWAAATGSPIFLAHFGGRGLSDGAKAALRDGGFERVLVLGSRWSVSNEVEAEARALAGLSADRVIRLGGEDRYETSALIAAWVTSADRASSERLSFFSVAVACGDKHPDALSGGALQGRDGGPILLTPLSGTDAKALRLVSDNAGSIGELRFFGNEYSVAPGSVRDFVNAVPRDSVSWRPSDDVAVPLK